MILLRFMLAGIISLVLSNCVNAQEELQKPGSSELTEVIELEQGVASYTFKLRQSKPSKKQVVVFNEFDLNKFKNYKANRAKGLIYNNHYHFFQLNPFTGRIVGFEKAKEVASATLYNIRIETADKIILLKNFKCGMNTKAKLKDLMTKGNCQFPSSVRTSGMF